MAGKDEKFGNSWTDDATTQAVSIELVRPKGRTLRPALRQISGPGAPRLHAICEAMTTIGRGSDVDLHISSPQLSRRHVQLAKRGEELHCIDLESANGVYLNGVKVHSCTLRSGDTIQIGDVTFVFDEVEM